MGTLMAKDWGAVEELMRELGSVRRAANSLRGGDAARLAIDRAIRDAADAVDQTIDGPNSHERLTAARQAIGVAIEVILALDAEVGRSLRIRSRAATLSEQARALIDRATRDQGIRFLPRPPSGHDRIARFLSPLAQAGYTVTVEAASDEAVWRIGIGKGGRALSFRVPKAASSPEWEAVVHRALDE